MAAIQQLNEFNCLIMFTRLKVTDDGTKGGESNEGVDDQNCRMKFKGMQNL